MGVPIQKAAPLGLKLRNNLPNYTVKSKNKYSHLSQDPAAKNRCEENSTGPS